MTQRGKQFLEEVSKNESLREKFSKIDRNEEGACEKAAALAKEFGFDLEPQDLSMEAPQGLLSDDDLEGAAGGMDMTHEVPIEVPENKDYPREQICCATINGGPGRDNGKSDVTVDIW